MSTRVEMSAGGPFDRRVRRLAGVSLIVLGVLWALARATSDNDPMAGSTMLAGWLLMPSLLTLSLKHPALRYLLSLPSVLVFVGVVATIQCVPDGRTTLAAGWVLVAVGIALGGMLGMWFWYRWLPVPAALDDPFSRSRRALIGIHVALILGGLIAILVDYAR